MAAVVYSNSARLLAQYLSHFPARFPATFPLEFDRCTARCRPSWPPKPRARLRCDRGADAWLRNSPDGPHSRASDRRRPSCHWLRPLHQSTLSFRWATPTGSSPPGRRRKRRSSFPCRREVAVFPSILEGRIYRQYPRRRPALSPAPQLRNHIRDWLVTPGLFSTNQNSNPENSTTNSCP